MNAPTVYLAGPIMGCTEGAAKDWRRWVAEILSDEEIHAVSPLRCEPLIGEIYTGSDDDAKFGTARAIGSKNLFDVRRCDMGIYYLPKNPMSMPSPLQYSNPALEEYVLWHQSWGTMQEMAWAFILGKPTILVSDDPAVLSHPVINYNASWSVSMLDEAVEIILGVLGGYTPGGKHV